MNKLAMLAGAILLMQSCTYAISPDLANRADKTIPFEAIEQDPDLYKGKILIVGGIISQTTSVKRGVLIEVLQKPLDYWGKPRRTTASGGSFLVYSPAPLDPLVYSAGREITVAGEVAGTRSKTLDDREYPYPILLSKELKLWPKEHQSWDRPQYLDPLYDPSDPGSSMRRY